MTDDFAAEKLKQALNIAIVLGDTIKAKKEGIPSGELYANVMGSLDLNTYEKAISLLVSLGLVKKENNVLTWIGG